MANIQQKKELELLPQEIEEALNQNLDIARKVDAVRVEQEKLRTCSEKIQFEAGKLVGQVQSLNLVKSYADTGRLVILQQIKESKAYKGMQIPQEDGTMFSPNGFGEFCEKALGCSRDKVEEDLKNLQVFGEEFLQAASKMGLGYRELRKLRALPEGEIAQVLESEALTTNDPEILKDLIEEIAAKQAKTKKELEETKANYEAAGKVSDEVNKKLRKAKEELTKLKNIAPDEQAEVQAEKEKNALATLNKEALELLGFFGRYVAHVRGIFEEENLSPASAELVTQLTSGICRQFADELITAGIDIDFRVLVYPRELGNIALRGDSEGINEGGEGV